MSFKKDAVLNQLILVRGLSLRLSLRLSLISSASMCAETCPAMIVRDKEEDVRPGWSSKLTLELIHLES